MAKEKNRKVISASSITTVISMALVLFMLGLLGVLIISAKKISDHVKENIGFHVYLKESAKEDAVDRLGDFLEASSYVKSWQYVSRDSAAAVYQRELGEDFVEFIGYNPLPASMEVLLKADYANSDSIAWIRAQIMEFRSVDEFDYQESLVNMVNQNINRIAMVLLAFIALLMLVALGLINNTIRLAIYSKRYLIKTMQLVGATGSFIRWPFLKNGVQQGILAGIFANIILSFALYAAAKRIPDLEQLTDARMITWLFGLVILLGVIISGISTYFAVRKYLRLQTEELYK